MLCVPLRTGLLLHKFVSSLYKMAARFACALAARHGKITLSSTAKSKIFNKICQVALVQRMRCISTINGNFQRYFTKDHEWIDVTDNVGTVGITNHAQLALGELVYIELPEVDTEYDKDDPVGTVESVKAASDVMTPVSGAITGVNEELSDTPALMNKNPEDKGWMFKISLSNESELEGLLDESEYKSFLKETEE